jgi:NAD(P)-dependent dehydrogenase (short-subunit alcohol dehydrogenase family)
MAQSSAPFAGRTAIVTGSGRNIGRAIALALAEGGANVVVNGHRDLEAVDRVVREIGEAGGRALGVMADVSAHDQVAELVRKAVAAFGAVDIAISNVAIRPKQAFLDISLEDWNAVLATNLSAAFYLARNAVPHMRARRWGRIIHISGFDGFWAQITERAHNITCKAGLHGLAKALAREFGADGITANTVVPGAIDTVRDWSQYAHQEKARLEAEIPSGRYGKTEEVAAACAFLCAETGAFVSGQAIHVNGGHYMY